jgi:hypothetical protein
LLGSSNTPVYIDDVEVREVLPPTSAANHLDPGKSDFDIYPNPATDRITLVSSLFQEKDIEIRIVNLQGKILVSKILKSTSNTFPLAINLKSGIYFLELKSVTVREVKPLVVKL